MRNLRPRLSRFLAGSLAGAVASLFVAPPLMLVPITGHLIWALSFAIPAGLIGAILPVPPVESAAGSVDQPEP